MGSGGKQLAHTKRRQTKKAIQKLKNLRKKGKLKRHVINAYREINSKKHAGSRQKATNVRSFVILFLSMTGEKGDMDEVTHMKRIWPG